MPFTASKDTENGDKYFDISQTEKRLIRATVKTYEKTGSYVFLKLFKKQEPNSEDFTFEQRIGLIIDEFHKLVKKGQKIKNSVVSETAEVSSDSEGSSEAKPPAAKRARKTPNSQTKVKLED